MPLSYAIRLPGAKFIPTQAMQLKGIKAVKLETP
jgi:hypothetical protein